MMIGIDKREYKREKLKELEEIERVGWSEINEL
jgi:hypothetical protein